MFGNKKPVIFIAVFLITTQLCSGDVMPALSLYSPGEAEYTEVLVHRIGDNLTLVCELKGDPSPRVFVWNYVSDNGTDGGRPFTIEPGGPTVSSQLDKVNLLLTDSGHYMCSAPPFSVTKYILVQPQGPTYCARGALWCGLRCVLPAYVCDGRRDCVDAEDEAAALCGPMPCSRSDRLNCSSGRCVAEGACCARADSLCRQPACCDEHARYSRLHGYVDVEFPPLFEDRHAPDDYGFIQSTIYTVTACALIFMVAVVLLVSALCKMHMKRAALRGYALAHRRARDHYAARYPPRYEAAQLLQPAPAPAPAAAPQETIAVDSPVQSPEGEAPQDNQGFGLARLSNIFCSRYRQVPTECCDVEMTDVRSTSLNNSPTRNHIDEYRSPTCCDSDLYFTNPDLTNCGRDLNYMATPIEFFRRRTRRRNTLDIVMDQLAQVQRPLTLQLGRFQLSIPRFGRRPEEPRPDTPNVAEINIDDLDFVRLNSNETYTLNGRTIRLLGADFENYPVLDNRPPPYNEAMRYKTYGPPPEYLSREGINRSHNNNENEARTNIEMPPCYEDLASALDTNANTVNVIDITDVTNQPSDNNNEAGDTNNDIHSINASNDTNNVTNVITSDATNNIVNGNNVSQVTDYNRNGVNSNDLNNVTDIEYNNNNNSANIINNTAPETISSIIDNLPAIDSDVNANETRYTVVANQ